MHAREKCRETCGISREIGRKELCFPNSQWLKVSFPPIFPIWSVFLVAFLYRFFIEYTGLIFNKFVENYFLRKKHSIYVNNITEEVDNSTV